MVLCFTLILLLWDFRTLCAMDHFGPFAKKWMFMEKQPSRDVLRKMCSENMQQILQEDTHVWHGCLPVKFVAYFILHVLHIFYFSKCDFNKLQSNFIEISIAITFRQGCSPVNLLHIRNMFLQEQYWGLLLCICLYTHGFIHLYLNRDRQIDTQAYT